MEKYYWIKYDGRIKEISEDTYFEWATIKSNNHRILRITKSEVEYSENGLNLKVRKDLLKKILDLN